MVVHTTYSESRANLAALFDKVVDDRETVIITRRGRPAVALIAADELAGLEETAHLLRSPANASRLLSALTKSLNGSEPAQSLADLRAEFGLDEQK